MDKPKPVTLRELRELRKVTQTELARALGQGQPDVSDFEKREDRKVQSLRRYLEGLGATLEVLAVVGRTRYRLTDV